MNAQSSILAAPSRKGSTFIGVFWVLILGLAVNAAADPILDWTALLLNAIRLDDSAPTLASRNLAILHTAIYDAVNGIEQSCQPYRFHPDPPPGASSEAAAVAAAYAVIQGLYPPSQGPADDLYTAYVTETPASESLTNGLAYGREIGQMVLSSRSADGATTLVPYIPSDAPGQWRRTPPFFRPPVDPQWRYLVPFCLPDIEPFVPPGPPALTSDQYASDVNEVQAIGALNSQVRTPDQSQTAIFWSDFSYTATPPGHWHEIASAVANSHGNSLSENARMFALLSMAQADSAIVCWEAKYRYNSWRPVTAIQRADEDGNPATHQDTNWTSFLSSPNFPEYSSGHSTFSKASATVLTAFYGTDALSFTVGSDAQPGVYRTYASLSACAEEIGLSRIYAGIHFPSAVRDGKACGAKIGTYVSLNYLLPNDRLPMLVIQAGAEGSPVLRVHGHIGKGCVTEASDDLHTWSAISTNTAVVGGFPIDHPAPDRVGSRFYRVREP